RHAGRARHAHAQASSRHERSGVVDSWSPNPVGTPLRGAAGRAAQRLGQRPHSSVAVTPRASLKVYAPVHLRSGLVYAARFHITARDDIKDAFLVLDPSWAEGYTVNGVAPQPVTEADRNGRIAYGFGHIPAGQSLIFFMSLQVNPTNVGRHSQNVELDDGETPILTVHRKVTIFP